MVLLKHVFRNLITVSTFNNIFVQRLLSAFPSILILCLNEMKNPLLALVYSRLIDSRFESYCLTEGSGVYHNKKAVLSQRCLCDAQSDNMHMVWSWACMGCLFLLPSLEWSTQPFITRGTVKDSAFWLSNNIKSAPKVVWEERVAVAQLCNKVPIGYNGTPQIHTKNCPFPSTIMHHPHLIHPSIDRLHSPSQTASGSN